MATQAYSDLIYLFLDGEATETERSVLFSALKESPALQEEFASAVSVKSAFATDALKLQAPTYLEHEIMEKAGLLASKLAGGSAASSALTTVPTAATPLFLKIGLLLFGGAAAGVITTVAINNSSTPTDRSARVAEVQNVQRTVPAPEAQTNSVATTPSPATTNATANNTANNRQSSIASGAAASDRNTASTAHRDAANRPSANSARSTVADPIASVSTERTVTTHSASNTARNTASTPAANSSKKNIAAANVEHSVATTNHADRTNDNSTVVTKRSNSGSKHTPSFANAASENPVAAVRTISDNAVPSVQKPESLVSEAPLVTAAMVREPSVKEIVGASEGKPRNPLLAVETYAPDWTSRLSFRLFSNTAVAMLPDRHVDGADGGGINRLGFGVGYDIGVGSTLGVEFARETFPIYLKGADGRMQPNRSIDYGGFSFERTFMDVNLPFGIHPFARVLAGVGSPGGVGKLDLGLSWQVAGGMSFSVAPEAMMVLFKDNGNLTTGSKFGFTAAIGFHL